MGISAPTAFSSSFKHQANSSSLSAFPMEENNIALTPVRQNGAMSLLPSAGSYKKVFQESSP